ncbi:MAG: GAF domain-containing protein [Chloroflexota bacterium]|nr:GAF domain-containing protein [Chloroflexota bacterium]
MTHILIVDDELSIRETFQAFLEEEGYKVSTAADFFEAEPFLAHAFIPPSASKGLGKVDVVVADIVLPHVNGLALLQRVHQFDDDIPVIMITGKPDVSTAAEAVRYGAYDYVAKPVTQQVLIRVIARAAERKNLLDDKRRLEAENWAYQSDLEKRVAERTAELEQRNRELTTLIGICHDISATLDLTEVLEGVTQRTAQVCMAHRCIILLLTRDEEMLIPLMSQFSDGRVEWEKERTFRGASGYSLPVDQVAGVQQAIVERRPLFVPDISVLSLPRCLIESFGVQSVLLVPLVSKERVVGLMALGHTDESQEFTAEQEYLAVAIGAQAAVAIENARLFEEESNSRRLVNTLREIAQALNSTLSLDDVLNLILTELEKVIAFDSSTIMLLEGKELVVRAVKGFTDPDSVLNVRLDLDVAPLNREAVESKQPLVVGSVHEDERWLKPREAFGLEPALHNICSWMGVPLVVKNRAIGMLTLDKVEDSFYGEKEAEIALAFANQAAIAIENARLYEATRKQLVRAQALSQASARIVTELNVEKTLVGVVHAGLEALGADRAAVYLYDTVHERIDVGYTYGLSPEYIQYIQEWFRRVPGYRILEGNTSFWVRDAQSDPEAEALWEIARREGYHSYVALALRQRDQVIGGLLYYHDEICTYTDEDIQLGQTLADQAAVALANARLYEEEQRRADELAALNVVTQAIVTTLDPFAIMQTVAEAVVTRLGFDAALVSLYSEREGCLIIAAVYPGGELLRRAEKVLGARAKMLRFTVDTAENPGYERLLQGQPWLSDRFHDFVKPSIDRRVADGMQRLYGNKSFISVPLFAGESLVGTILAATKKEQISQSDQETLLTVARQSAIAIQNARLYEEAQRRARQFEALTQVGRAIGSTLDLDEVLQLILERLEDVVPYDAVSLWLREGENLRIRAVRGFEFSEAHLALTVIIREDALSQEMVSTQRPLVIADAQQDGRFHSLAGTEWVRSWLGVPLLSKGEVIGLITIDKNEPGLYTAETAELALAFGQQAAVAIENARLYEQAQHRLQSLANLNRASQAITASLDVKEVLEQIVDLAGSVVHSDYTSVVLLDEGGEPVLGAEDFRGIPSITRRIRSDGVTRYVLDSGQPVVVDTISDEGTMIPSLLWPDGESVEANLDIVAVGIRSFAAVPIQAKGKTLGVLFVHSREVSAFHDQVPLLTTFANQAAVAIENAQLYEDTRRHVEELTALHNIDVAITSTLNPDEVLQVVYEQLSTVMDFAAFHVALYDEKKDELYLPIIVDQGERLPPRTLRGEGESGLSGWVIRTREPLWIKDMETERATLPVEAIALGVPTRSLMILPLMVRDKIAGVISAQSYDPHAFDKGHRRFFSGIARQVAIAVENARLFEAARRRTDELTSLHEAAVAVSSSLELSEVLHALAEQVGSALDASSAYICDWDEETTSTTVLAEWVGPEATDAERESDLGATYDMRRLPSTLRALQEKRPLVVQATDPDLDPADRENVERYGWKSFLIVPLVTRDRVIGYAELWETRQAREFTEAELRLCQTLAADAAVAIENARLFEETNRRLTETRLLQEVMQAVASTLDFDEVLTRTIETLHKTLGIEYLTFVLPDEQGDGLVLHPSWTGYLSIPADFRLTLDGSVVGQVYQSGEPQIIPDVREVPYYFDGASEIRSELAVPVKVAGRIVAVLNAESPHLGAFGEDDLRLFSAIAAQLGVVLENARLYEGANRRLAEAWLIQEVMLAAASTLNFDLVLERTVKALHRALDIDHLSFLLPDEQGGMLVSHPSLIGRMLETVEESFQVPIQGGLVGQAYQTGQPVLMRDEVESFGPDLPREIRSALAVPVRVSDHIVAVLWAESPQRGAFGEDELRLFTTIAGQLGVALENARLYQRLEAQTAELSRAYDELQEINRLRAELVQNVGHELRTPLGLVKGYVDLLLEGDLGDLLDSQRNALQVIHARTATLERLVHNLTMLQTVPRESLALAPVSVVEVMRHALEEFGSPAGRARVLFQDKLPAELPFALGDQERLQLVFSHLVDNAVKFSPDGGSITVCAWADQEMVYISIADEGIGIPPTHIDRIFERFYQVDGSTTRRFGGMGVGLALVWEIIEAHGGTVEVTSEPGRGSMFTIALPQAELGNQ